MLPCVYSKVIVMNDIDQILNALRKAGETGLLIEELADRLGIDNKSVTTMIETLMSEGLVMQKPELEEERYMIKTPVNDDIELARLSDMNGCPCFHCLKIGRCGVRQPDSPVTCRDIEEWMGTDLGVSN
ncbi:MAG: winged helix-turn-helix transcriptional regulator [Promethearchaeota archaeon]